MKRILLIAIALSGSLALFSQDFDRLMTKKQVDCSDISYNSSLLLIEYLEADKTDSAGQLLRYWEQKCGMREPIFRAKILLALDNKTYSDSLLTKGALNHIYNYQNRMDMIKYGSFFSYDNYMSYYGFVPPGQEFDDYTRELASRLKKNYQPGTMPYLLAEFYSSNYDTIFSEIQTKAYGQNNLTTEYEKAVDYYRNMGEFHMAWITGIWIPDGALKVLGNHPELGFQMGAKQNKMNYDFTIAIKFLDSPEKYYATRKKSGNVPELTDHFLGGYIGLDVGRDLLAQKGHELQITGGIALDGFDALPEDKDNDLKAASTWTYNFNLGLGYRYYITNTFYLGLRAKYNITDYSLNKVVDLKGNTMTVQLMIGGVNNIFRNNNLKQLRYKMRK